MTARPVGEPDPRVVALARDMERAGRRLGAVEALVRQLAADIAALAAADEAEPAPQVRSWLLADDPEQARADLGDLCEWLAAVYLRYPGAALPSCWLWHPAAVEELLWLRLAHADAYGPDGSPRDAGDWHDRQRPGVVTRLRAIAGCELAVHAPGGEQDRPAPCAPLARSADRIADAWTTRRTAPEPTADQLDEASRYDHAKHTTTTR